MKVSYFQAYFALFSHVTSWLAKWFGSQASWNVTQYWCYYMRCCHTSGTWASEGIFQGEVAK